MPTTTDEYTHIGKGIYSISEASRLTGVPPRAIRRWLLGYDFKVAGKHRPSPAVVAGEFELIDGVAALSFLDLLEIRFVNAFRAKGVSWKEIRATHEEARKLLNRRHPFSTGKFKTDGRSILLDAATVAGSQALLNVAQRQLEFRRLVAPFLKDLDFDGDEAVRWWPLGRRKAVVLDPTRSFGQAIVFQGGVPTAILAAARKTTKSIERVARWYEVSEKAVRDAIEFEDHLAA